MPFYFFIFMPVEMLTCTFRVKCLLLNSRIKNSFIKSVFRLLSAPPHFSLTLGHLEAMVTETEKGKAAES